MDEAGASTRGRKIRPASVLAEEESRIRWKNEILTMAYGICRGIERRARCQANDGTDEIRSRILIYHKS